MRRIFQTTILLLGGLLLILSGLITHARQPIERPLRWLIVCCLANPHDPNQSAFYLLEPTSGVTVRLTPYYTVLNGVDQLDDWFYYSGAMGYDPPNLYRVRVGGNPQLIVERLQWYSVRFSPDGQWAAFSRPIQNGVEWWSVPSDGGPIRSVLPSSFYSATSWVEGLNQMPVFSPDSAWLAFRVFHDATPMAIYRVRVDGSAYQNLTADLPDSAQLMGWPSVGLVLWSSPQSALYGLTDNPTNWQQLSLIGDNASMSPLWVLGQTTYAYLNNDHRLRALRWPDRHLLWQETAVMGVWTSPNAQWLLLTRASHQWVLRQADSPQRVVLNPPDSPLYLDNIQWSPTGRLALCVAFNQATALYEFWLLDLPSHQMKRILTDGPYNNGPFWSPDEQTLLAQFVEGTGTVWRLMNRDGDIMASVHVPNGAEPYAFNGWGPVADRLYNPTRLAGVASLLGGFGLVVTFRRSRKD